MKLKYPEEHGKHRRNKNFRLSVAIDFINAGMKGTSASSRDITGSDTGDASSGSKSKRGSKTLVVWKSDWITVLGTV